MCKNARCLEKSRKAIQISLEDPTGYSNGHHGSRLSKRSPQDRRIIIEMPPKVMQAPVESKNFSIGRLQREYPSRFSQQSLIWNIERLRKCSFSRRRTRTLLCSGPEILHPIPCQTGALFCFLMRKIINSTALITWRITGTISGKRKGIFEPPDGWWFGDDLGRILREREVILCLFKRDTECSFLQEHLAGVYVTICSRISSKQVGV